MRQAILVAVALSCMLVEAVDAYSHKGNELFEFCQSMDNDKPDRSSFYAGLCGGYIVGVADALEGSGTSWFQAPVSPSGRDALCLELAQSRHAHCADGCPLLGAKRTVTNRCLPISIYEYTA